MIFRQMFDSTSGTYSYLLASRRGGEALIIDPVLEKVDRYLQLLRELELKLVKAVDTHLHADHITGLGALRDRTHCITVMGEQSGVDVVSMRVSEGDKVKIEGVALDVLYTPGHTDDSYSFLLPDRVFTGDTLLIEARVERTSRMAILASNISPSSASCSSCRTPQWCSRPTTIRATPSRPSERRRRSTPVFR